MKTFLFSFVSTAFLNNNKIGDNFFFKWKTTSNKNCPRVPKLDL